MPSQKRKRNKNQTMEELYCLCQQPAGETFMICCDECNQWFHGQCVYVAEVEGVDYESICWHCPGCVNKLEENLRQCQLKNLQLQKDCWDALKINLCNEKEKSNFLEYRLRSLEVEKEKLLSELNDLKTNQVMSEAKERTPPRPNTAINRNPPQPNINNTGKRSPTPPWPNVNINSFTSRNFLSQPLPKVPLKDLAKSQPITNQLQENSRVKKSVKNKSLSLKKKNSLTHSLCYSDLSDDFQK